MAPFRPWADLHTELLCSIADGLSLKHYTSIRGACPAWRSALAPPLPSLLVIADGRRASALPFLKQGSLHVSTLNKYSSSFLGSSNGCFAVASEWLGIFLLNPLTGEEIKLLRMNDCGKVVPKVVFAPNPRPDDYTVVALCDGNKIAYTRTRDMKWFITDIAMDRDQLTDLAYDIDAGKVYCLTECGDVHVLHIPRGGRRRKPIVEPLLERAVIGAPFDPAPVFASPYHTASKLTRSKQIFVCNGSLYQVWRNTTGAIAWRLPAGGRFSASEDEIFVLRYYPGRQPCWDAVHNLGGYSVFIGKNNPAVVRAEGGVPWVRANCIYWIDERWRDVPMVFDMVTRTSTPFILPANNVQTPQCRASCWYFFSDNITSTDTPRKHHTSGDVAAKTSKMPLKALQE